MVRDGMWVTTEEALADTEDVEPCEENDHEANTEDDAQREHRVAVSMHHPS